jgi:hypothetical protein
MKVALAGKTSAAVDRSRVRRVERLMRRSAVVCAALVAVASLASLTGSERAGAAPSSIEPAASPLASRFDPPRGFARVAVEEGSFGAWLRALPLAPEGTPVRSFRGDVIHAADDGRIAAVAALDVSPVDLQQCADSIIRLHAEWRWSRGFRDASYASAAGPFMPFARWSRGERPIAKGSGLAWVSGGAGGDDHAAYRRWLDAVFQYANTVSLSRQARPVAAASVRPGDFFVHPGWPGHAVIALDVARAADGRVVALLGQGFMPAQSFHVLRASPESAWFTLDPRAPVATPFWAPFEWSELRRLD